MTTILLSELASIVCPIFYFHSKEKYFPCSLSDFVKASELRDDKTNTVIVSNEAFKANPLEELAKVTDKLHGSKPTSSPKQDVNLQIVDKSIYKNKDGEKEIYCMFSDPIEVDGWKYVHLTYFMIFGFNGTIEWHTFDMEYVTLRLQIDKFQLNDNTDWSLTNPQLVSVYMSSHGNGFWYNRDEIEFEGLRPVVYSSYESHAMRKKAKIHKRILLFGNDYTNRGIRYDPVKNVIVLANTRSRLLGEFYKKNKAYYYPGKFVNQQSALYRKNIYHVLNYKGYLKLEGGISDLKKQLPVHLRRGLIALAVIMFLWTVSAPLIPIIRNRAFYSTWMSVFLDVLYRYYLQVLSSIVTFLILILVVI
jgi:hypothetical protein